MDDFIRKAHAQGASQLAEMLPEESLNARATTRMMANAALAVGLAVSAFAAPQAEAAPLTPQEQHRIGSAGRQAGAELGRQHGYHGAQVGGQVGEAVARQASGMRVDPRTVGAAIGAPTGALIGKKLAGKKHGNLGIVIGGVGGTIVGGQIGAAVGQSGQPPVPQSGVYGAAPVPGGARVLQHGKLSQAGYPMVSPDQAALPPVLAQALKKAGATVNQGPRPDVGRSLAADPVSQRHLDAATGQLLGAGDMYRNAQQHLQQAQLEIGERGLVARNEASAHMVNAQRAVQATAEDWIRVSNSLADRGFNVKSVHDYVRAEMADLHVVPQQQMSMQRPARTASNPFYGQPR